MSKCVYIHIRNDTGEVFYVGEGSYKRPYVKSGRNAHWKNIVKKAGYEVIVLYTRLTKEIALDKEAELKELYGMENLVNMLDGHESIKQHTQETKDKMSKAAKGKKKSKETRAKMTEVAKNRVYTKEIRNNMSKGQQGNKHTQETKDKMKISQIQRRRRECQITN